MELASLPEERLTRLSEFRRPGEDAQTVVETIEHMVLTALPEWFSEETLTGYARVDIKELNRLFVIVRGVGLQAGLRNVRLDELKRRLEADVSLSPRVAALQCGFGSLNVAQRFFKMRFGMWLTDMNAPPSLQSRDKPGGNQG